MRPSFLHSMVCIGIIKCIVMYYWKYFGSTSEYFQVCLFVCGPRTVNSTPRMQTFAEKFWIGQFVIRPTPLPCFPLKSHRAVVLLGAMQVNISISLEQVLFVSECVFLGLSAETWPRLGSHPICFFAVLCSFFILSGPAERNTNGKEQIASFKPAPFQPVMWWKIQETKVLKYMFCHIFCLLLLLLN